MKVNWIDNEEIPFKVQYFLSTNGRINGNFNSYFNLTILHVASMSAVTIVRNAFDKSRRHTSRNIMQIACIKPAPLPVIICRYSFDHFDHELMNTVCLKSDAIYGAHTDGGKKSIKY